MDKKQKGRRLFVIGWAILCLGAGMPLTILFTNVGEPSAQTARISPAAPGSFSGLVKEARQSVVNISTVKVIRGGRIFRSPFGQNDPFYDWFERFFEDQIPKDYRQRSLGSGVIIDKDGFILTNNHVVEGTDEIKVKLINEKEYDAIIIGRDPRTDLALIRIETEEALTPLPLGDSEKLEVGDWVVAIGNPFGLGHTVTAGIVSAKYRHIGAGGAYDNFIQTDAPINPGNSGGPLLNTQGEVIGISTFIYSGSGGSIGIGFAIPINMAKDLIPQLKKGEVVRGWLGVLMSQEITPELREIFKLEDEGGVLVADVVSGGPAEEAGIAQGDVIISFDGKETRKIEELQRIVASTPVGKRVTVEVIRKGKKKSFKVKIVKSDEAQEGKEPVKEKSHLGMTVKEITPELARQFGLSEQRGLVVTQVEDNSPAEEARIGQGDIVVEIDWEPVRNVDAYRKRIRQYKKGDTILFLVNRGGTPLYLTLKVRE